MKKFGKSLVLSFALVAGAAGIGAQTAQAQTVPVHPQGQVYNQQAGAQVSQGAIDDLAYNVGVQTPYYRAGVGFTQGTSSDGENVGLKFILNGQNATVTAAYNMDDPNARTQFQAEVNNGYATEQRLAQAESANRYTAPTYVYYEPAAYVIVAPVRPIIAFGLIIGGWYPGYVPVYHNWNGFWDGYGHRHYDNHNNNHTTIINNNTTVINHGNGGQHTPWVGGGGDRGHDHSPAVVHNPAIIQDNHQGDHNRRVVTQPAHQVAPPVQAPARTARVEPPHVQQAPHVQQQGRTGGGAQQHQGGGHRR